MIKKLLFGILFTFVSVFAFICLINEKVDAFTDDSYYVTRTHNVRVILPINYEVELNGSWLEGVSFSYLKDLLTTNLKSLTLTVDVYDSSDSSRLVDSDSFSINDDFVYCYYYFYTFDSPIDSKRYFFIDYVIDLNLDLILYEEMSYSFNSGYLFDFEFFVDLASRNGLDSETPVFNFNSTDFAVGPNSSDNFVLNCRYGNLSYESGSVLTSNSKFFKYRDTFISSYNFLDILPVGDSQYNAYNTYFYNVYNLTGVSNDDANYYYDLGYNSGYPVGYDDGYLNGNSVGYNSGYYQGLADQSNSIPTLLVSLSAIPFNIFGSILNFDILGFNFYYFVTGLLTLGVVLWLIKKFFKGD